jgi:hypothetical protein
MKKFIALLTGVLATSGLFAEDAPIRGPRIFCEQPEFNFGVVDNRTQVEHTFVIKNIGDTTLEIENVRAACGCTVADVSTRSIPPGGESRMTARLNLAGRRGQQSKPITITSNDPEQNQYTVSLVGTASEAVQLSTDRLMFGQISPGQEMTLPIDVQSGPGETINIQQVETGNEHITVAQETLESGQTRLNVTMRGPLQPGNHNSVIRIKTDLAARPLIEIPVFANVVGEIIHAPQELVLPPDAGSAPLTRYVVLRTGSAEAFQISQVELPDPSMTHTILPFGAQGYRLQIDNIIPSPALNGTSVKISTTAASMPVIEIPIRVGN